MGIFSKLFSTAVDSGYRDPEYFEDLGECDHDCLMCDHRDVDCEGDEMEDDELFHELYEDDDDDW